MDERRDPQISVVIPAFNEEARLSVTLPQLWNTLKDLFTDFEAVVVDDGSVDGTAEKVSCFSANHEEVRLIRCGVNRGKGHAVRTGMLAARGKFVCFSDADFSTPAGEVTKLLGAIANGCDVAIASRAHGDTKILRRQASYRETMGKTFNRFVRLLGMGDVRDTQCGFKCFTRQAARDIFRDCRINGFSFDVEALYLARMKGYRIGEVGVLWRNDPTSRVHPVKHSLQMLKELLMIRYYITAGHYRRPGVVRTRTEA